MRIVLSLAAAGALLFPAAASAQLLGGQAGGSVTGGLGSTTSSLGAGVGADVRTDALNRTTQTARRLETEAAHAARRTAQRARVTAIHTANQARAAARRATNNGLHADARVSGDTSVTRPARSTAVTTNNGFSLGANRHGANVGANTDASASSRPR